MTDPNLETIEQRCLSYLEQVNNPLARLDALHEFLTKGESAIRLTQGELKDFLVKHERFRIIEPLELPQEDDTVSVEPGLAACPYVILETRLPSEREMATMMLDQLNDMHQALGVAHDEAQNKHDTARMNSLQRTLERLQQLKNKLAETIKNS